MIFSVEFSLPSTPHPHHWYWGFWSYLLDQEILLVFHVSVFAGTRERKVEMERKGIHIY